MARPFSLEDIRTYFVKGIKKPADRQIGVEWEKIGVYRDSGKAITYWGVNSVEAIFRGLIQKHGWQPADPNRLLIALKKKNGSITLEPGGQIELSGQKARLLSGNARELYGHLEEIKKISEPLGIAWLGIGAQPFSVTDDIDWVPKERYKIMRESLKGKGSLTYAMMKETASVQVSLDFTSEEDAITKLKLANGLSPFLTAMFANSPLKQGRNSGYLSRRALIWERTAPGRAGILWDNLDPRKGFDCYTQYALQVPMLFILRKGRWLPVNRITFKRFMENGYLGHQASLEDWKLHLTGIFTEARLKQYVEIRSIDCQKTPMGLASAAFIKGIFYHEPSLKQAYKFIGKFKLAELKSLHSKAAKRGLRFKLPGGKSMQDFCLALLDLAADGLENEKSYLEPLRDNLEKGITPAELVLKCFNSKKPILLCTAIEG